MKVTVITPVYERFTAMAAWIQCNLSLQTHLDMEYIIGDDCSPNWSTAIESLKSTTIDPRLTVFRLQDRKPWSLGDIFNIGAEMATGEILLFCCADILMLPNSVEAHASLHGRFNNVLIEGTAQFVSPEQEQSLLKDPKTIFNIALLEHKRKTENCLGVRDLCDNPDCSCLWLPHGASIRKCIFDQVGGFRPEYAGHYAAFDYDLQKRLEVIRVRAKRSYLPRAIQVIEPTQHAATGRATATQSDPISVNMLQTFINGLPGNYINKNKTKRPFEIIIDKGTWK